MSAAMALVEDGLYRVESAVSATASGNLTDGQWPHDVSTALGFAGLRNPLGFAVVRYLSDEPSSVSVWNVVLNLTSELNHRGICGEEAKNAAWQAFDFWRDIRCRSCHGRGHVGDVHAQCPACRGSGHRRLPDGPEPLRAAISALVEAEQRMEGQLRARLNGSVSSQSDADRYRLSLPSKVGNDVGSGGSAITPRAPLVD